MEWKVVVAFVLIIGGGGGGVHWNFSTLLASVSPQ